MFYLLAMQWIPFWGSDWTLSMGIFITEGGRNWGWRKTVGKADEHQHNHFVFLAKWKMHTSTMCKPPFLHIQTKQGVLQMGPLKENGHSRPIILDTSGQEGAHPGMSLHRTVLSIMQPVIWD